MYNLVFFGRADMWAGAMEHRTRLTLFRLGHGNAALALLPVFRFSAGGTEYEAMETQPHVSFASPRGHDAPAAGGAGGAAGGGQAAPAPPRLLENPPITLPYGMNW